MNYKKILIVPFLFLLLTQGTCFADTQEALIEQQTPLPVGAKEIPECSLSEQKQIIKLLPKEEVNKVYGGKPQFHDDYIGDYDGDTITLYKGNFSNSGYTEYLFLSQHGGSLDTDTVVAVYRLANNHLVKLDFDNILIKSLPNGNIENFYLWVANPFAITKDGKTYIRFLDRQTQLVCTYLWQGDNIKLIGPDRCIGSKEISK